MRSPAVPTAFLLSGGLGTRLKEAVPNLPKAMAPVAGRPFAEWLILGLREQGIRRIVFCTGHRAEQIEDHFGDGTPWDLEISYSRETVALGTGGALRLAASREPADPVLALNADSYCPFFLERLEATHREKAADATLWLVLVEDCSRYGSVRLDAEGRVTAFLEKSAEHEPGLVSAGIYLFRRAVLEALPADRPLSLETEVLPNLAGGGLWGVRGDGPLVDIGTPESYGLAQSLLAAAGRR